jgi:hypothetical protein
MHGKTEKSARADAKCRAPKPYILPDRSPYLIDSPAALDPKLGEFMCCAMPASYIPA